MVYFAVVAWLGIETDEVLEFIKVLLNLTNRARVDVECTIVCCRFQYVLSELGVGVVFETMLKMDRGWK